MGRDIAILQYNYRKAKRLIGHRSVASLNFQKLTSKSKGWTFNNDFRI